MRSPAIRPTFAPIVDTLREEFANKGTWLYEICARIITVQDLVKVNRICTMATSLPAVGKPSCLDCQKADSNPDVMLKCKKHYICYNCCDEREVRPEFTRKIRECQKCHPEVFQTQPTEPPKVWIYVDDSNLWIEGKKAYAEAHKLLTSEDPRARFDIGKLHEVVAEGREVGGRILYGSKPPPVDTVWARVEEQGWKVDIKQKSYHTGKEKQVDVQLVADIVDLVGQMKNGTVIIVSGDSDYIPAINKALTRGWKVEVWSWERALSADIREHDRRGKGLRVEELNGHIHHIMSVNSSFDPTRFTKDELLLRLQEASILLTVSEKCKQRSKRWKEFNDTIQGIVKWPVLYLQVSNAKGYVEVLAIFLSVNHEKPGLDKCIKEIGKTKNMKQLNLTTKPLTFRYLHKSLGDKLEWLKPLLLECKSPDVQYEEDTSDTQSVSSACARSRRSSGVPITPQKASHKETEILTTYKTKRCRNYDKSSCPNGDQCKFAHGDRDPMAWCTICRKKGHVAGDSCYRKCSKS